MAESCKAYLTSYVLNHDIVPRFSLESMDHLRDGIFEVIARIKVTKYQASHAEPDTEEAALLHGKESIPSSKFQEQLQRFHQHQEEIRAGRQTRDITLCPPGKIVHLVKTNEDTEPARKGCCCSPRSSEVVPEAEITRTFDYAPLWAHRSDLAEITISSHFLSDHSSLNVMAELEKTAAERFGLTAPFVIRAKDSAAAHEAASQD